jgi:peptidoglycan hydrolase-like protein with peptidoglycan-binding domain
MGATNALGLTVEQTKELQQAINAAGCDAGPADGMLTEKTRAGIACVRKERHIEGTDLNDVLKSLGLSFTTKSGMPPADSSGRGRTG